MTTEHQIAILTEAINKLAEAVEKLDVELRGRPRQPPKQVDPYKPDFPNNVDWTKTFFTVVPKP